MPHLTYSLDVALCDNWLSDFIKRNLSGPKDEDSLLKLITKVLNFITKKESRITYNKLVDRMKLCIKNKEEVLQTSDNIIISSIFQMAFIFAIPRTFCIPYVQFSKTEEPVNSTLGTRVAETEKKKEEKFPRQLFSIPSKELLGCSFRSS